MESLTLTLDDSSRKELLEFYSEKLKKLDSQRKGIMDIIKQLDDSSKDDAQLKIDSKSHSQYKKRWSRSNKMRYVIKEAGKCLSTREIVQRIGEYEPELVSESTYNDTRKQIASTISGKVKVGKIFNRYKSVEDIYLNGLIEWFHSDGVVMDAFKRSDE